MSAGAEGQPRIEHYIDGVRFGGISPAGANPQALTHTHGMKTIHPRPLPVLIRHMRRDRYRGNKGLGRDIVGHRQQIKALGK